MMSKKRAFFASCTLTHTPIKLASRNMIFRCLSETPAILKDLLELIRRTDGEHYESMVSRLQPPGGDEEEASQANGE